MWGRGGCRGAVAQWLERKTGDQGVLGSNPADGTSLRYFRNSFYPTLPVSFGGKKTNPALALEWAVWSIPS